MSFGRGATVDPVVNICLATEVLVCVPHRSPTILRVCFISFDSFENFHVEAFPVWFWVFGDARRDGGEGVVDAERASPICAAVLW